MQEFKKSEQEITQKTKQLTSRELNCLAAQKIEKIIEDFNLDLKFNDRFYVGCCPIHGGDNPTAFNLYPDGDSFPGFWCCHTHHCEESGSGLINLIMQIKKWNYSQAKNYVLNLGDFQPSPKKTQPSRVFNIERAQIRASLKIPSQYFVQRGFSSEVLNRYDVGLCQIPGKEMYKRVVFPVYYNQKFVGCVGRTISKVTEYNPKWRPNKGFRVHNYLYNYDNIMGDTVIVTESCGNVLKLVQNQIVNCVGIFGTKLYTQQVIDLELKGIKNLILCLDNDEAGQKGAKKIQEKYTQFNVQTIKLEKNDIAEMTDLEIKEKFNAYCFVR